MPHDPQPDPETRPQAAPQPDPGSQSKPDSESKPDSQSEPVSELKPDSPLQGPQEVQELAGTAPFSRVLMGLGIVLLLFVVWHLALRGLRQYPVEPRWQVPGGDPERGPLAIQKYGCGSCHVIAGIRDATGRVGPQLTGIREQIFIGGQLPNTPHNLVFWIQNPQRFAPGTAMPDLPVTDAEARDIAAYLYSLD